jgi:opacity protein-like surface antigen
MPLGLAAWETGGGDDFLNKHFAGGRIGVWSNTGDDEIPGDTAYSLDFSKSSLYAEFFYAHRISRPLSIEFFVGIYSRGDVEYFREENTLVSSASLFPFILSARLYPLYSVNNLPFHPYLQPGIGLVYGKQDIIDYDVYYDYGIIGENSRTKFTYSLSAGIDVPVADQIALTLNSRYTPVEFGKPLAQLKDYSGWAVTFGVGYIFKK